MSIEQEKATHVHTDENLNRCPVDHRTLSQQKTARVVEPVGLPIECDAAGVWHVRGFDEARSVLRSLDTKQAGFNAELFAKLPKKLRAPILFQDGKPHHQQRKQVARFFAPKVVSESYERLMERMVDGLIGMLQREKRVDLSRLSLELAVRVAAEVVGLTNSRVPGMAQRLEVFFAESNAARSRFHTIMRFVRDQTLMLVFFLLDVLPAIRARRRSPQEDVISHLVSQGAKNSEILIECITYAAAGMATTREFISIAAWHFLERPELRIRYLSASQEERYDMLGEVLRLEPIIGRLYRRTTAPLSITSAGQSVTIPEGALIDLHIYGMNADAAVVGEHALELCPGRVLKKDSVPAMLMGFGDGYHRCPGSYIAIQETDILLQRLLALDGLRIEQAPALTWNDLITGYELRKFYVSIA